MSFEIEQTGPNGFELRGRFDASREEQVRKVFDQVDDSCVLDFEQVSYISSAGLGLLVALQLRLSKEGHQVTLVNVNPHIQELLRLAGLDSIFSIR